MKTLSSILLLLVSFSVMATDTMIKGFELVAEKPTENRLSIKVQGNLNDNPQMIVGKNSIELVVPNSRVAGKIVRNIRGAVITASQADRESVNVKVVLPYSLAGRETLANITLKDGSIDVYFPRIASASTVLNAPANKAVKTSVVNETINKAVAQAAVENKEAEKFDENYLSQLVKENEKIADKQHPEKAEAQVKKTAQADTASNVDRVNLAQASVQKETPKTELNAVSSPKSNFSISTYVGKFVAFLSLMILGFYGVLTLFKKGVIKKGKLGFLHSTKMVEVISTTHVAPKRSLMMVKAHKQVFLVSNTESGIQLISEIQDVTGIIKTGEEEITGSNFDTNLYSANKTEKEFKLKEDVAADNYSLDDMLNEDFDSIDNIDTKSTNAAKAIEKAPVRDQVKFSDQIKTKMKNMKQIQY